MKSVVFTTFRLMIKFRLLVFVTLLLVLANGHTGAQHITYDVVKGDKVIGKMTVDKIVSGDKVTLNIKNDVEFTLLFSFTSLYWLSETFENGILVSGDSHNDFNGRRQKETKLKRNGSKYYIISDEVSSYFGSKDLTYSVSNFYFTEPKDGQEVFSQWFGRFMTMKQDSPHVYEVSSPDGTNTYWYNNGICTKVKVSRDFATFYFKIQDESLARLKSN